MAFAPAWILGAVAGAYGLHVLWQPLWVSMALAIALLWRMAVDRGRLPLPPRIVRWTLAGAAMAAVVATHGRTFALDAGTELLCLAAGLKVLEAQSRRDMVLVVLVAYVLAATHVLFAQHLAAAASMLASVVVSTAALASLTAHRPWREDLRVGAWVVLQALPLGLLAFVAIPRLSAGVVGLPLGRAPQGVTGLAETVQPGSIGRLAQSSELALRVAMDGEIPPRTDWYWRAIVLDSVDADGVWTQRRTPMLWQDPPPARWQGRVTLEPHHLPWLVSLDVPTAAPPGARLDQWGRVRWSQPVRDRLVYACSSASVSPPWDGDPGWTMLPPRLAPRTRQLVATWQGGPEAVAQAALAFFAQGGFRYTLDPVAVPGDPVDGFMFETREGFCEHYAAALAVMLRAARIPARVVAGYLGGEVNAVTGHITVRQSDAHAWVEAVLDPTRGWQRLDPTLAVAPERALRALAQGVGAIRPRLEPVGLHWLRMVWDAADHTWSHWVLDFTAERQRRLAAALAKRLPVGAAAGVVLVLGVQVAGWWRRRRRTDDLAAAYADVRRWLGRQGMHCPAWEGPRSLRRRVEAELPAAASWVGELLGRYELLRYGGSADAAAAAQLRREIRRRTRRIS